MANLHARADGDWTAAATWGLCDATALLDAQNANTVLTTAFVSSAAFTPGAIVLDGIAVKVASRASSPSGTMSVRLANAGVAVAGTTVTINVADIPNNLQSPTNTFSGCSLGWVFFQFTSAVTLVAATAYTLQATTSVATQVNLFRDGTGANWSRLLRTTTTGAPAAGDSMFIGGQWTAAGTKTDRVVTYNGTASTDYGGASLILASLGVSKGGTLTLQTTASTNYVLRLSGVMQVWQEGLLSLGTSGARLPASSTFLLEFDCALDADFGYCWYSTVNIYGSDPWATGVVSTRLTADAAIAATGLTVADTTGWKSGNAIAIAPTQRNAVQGETRDLNADAAGTSLAFASGLSNLHVGSAAFETQADVINLSRLVTIRNVTATASTYGYLRGATITAEWATFRYHGFNGRVGFDVGLASVLSFSRCAFVDCEDDVFAPVFLGASTLTFASCVAWNWGGTSAGAFISNAGATTNTLALTDCVLIGRNNAAGSITLQSGGALTLTRTRISGCGLGLFLGGPLAALEITDCEFYSHGTGAATALFLSQDHVDARVVRSKFWRNGNEGAIVVNSYDVLFEDCEFYGNAGAGMLVDDSYVRIHGGVFASETGFTTSANLNLTAGEDDATRVVVHGVEFSQVTGNRIAATVDVNPSITTKRQHVLVSGCLFGAATEIATTALEAGSTLAIQRRDDVTAVNTFRHFGYGQTTLETSTVGAASPSIKMTPEHARRRCESQRMGTAVPSGQVCTFSVSVQKNAAYTGAAPRLVLKANGAAGIDKDVVLDTLSVGADTWEVLTGASAAVQEDAVLEVVVDCTGTAGAVFVDDFAAVSA